MLSWVTGQLADATGDFECLVFIFWPLIMAALCNRADHYNFDLWFLSLFLFFPRLISAVAGWMSTIL